jgi:hypothetical protein
MDIILKIIEKIKRVYFFYVLWVFVLILDCILLKFCDHGFLEIDFRKINLNFIKYIILMLFIFWITYYWFSYLIDLIIINIGIKFPCLRNKKYNSNYISIYELEKKAISSNNSTLMKYTLNEEKNKKKIINYRKIIYTLFIFFIINITFPNSLIRNIFYYLFNNCIVILFILIVVFGIILLVAINNSINNDDDKTSDIQENKAITENNDNKEVQIKD